MNGLEREVLTWGHRASLSKELTLQSSPEIQRRASIGLEETLSRKKEKQKVCMALFLYKASTGISYSSRTRVWWLPGDTASRPRASGPLGILALVFQCPENPKRAKNFGGARTSLPRMFWKILIQSKGLDLLDKQHFDL